MVNDSYVSILLCTHNAEQFIKETVFSILNQTYQNFEVLIFDDNSQDKTKEIIETLLTQNSKLKGQNYNSKVKTYHSQTNIGPYEGLNKLLDKARGKYIAINDHDDIWHPEKLEKQVDFLEKNKEFVACGSAIINWYEKYDAYQYRSQSQNSDIAWHTSLVFRNDTYRYDTKAKIGTDFYFMKNVLSKNKKKIYNFQEPFVLRRIFKDNLSGKWMKQVQLKEILQLQIGLMDKLSLLNRFILPEEFVNRIITIFFSGNIPNRYQGYAKTLSSTLSNLRL